MLPPYLPEEMLVEGLMLTCQVSQGVTPAACNLAPMGPIVTEGFERFLFRPFKSSSTYRNLKATGQGVFHITDDACLIARAAVSKLRVGEDVKVVPAKVVEGLVLADACRAYELKVESLEDQEERTTIIARAVHVERLRDFWGFNRARHAILEAAILATRLHLTGKGPVLEEYAKLQVAVDKTGGQKEQEAMAGLRRWVEGRG